MLGILESVDLRTVWAHEALNFTRWLAMPENIQLLCNELDIEIEDIRVEEATGRYNADIVGIEVASKKKIIIENQLERTDHKHLGQIITYTSGLDADIVIWIAKDYNDEHKAAIDWLNRNITTGVKFFLIQIELWKIGDSLPAPKFNIVSQPNDWIRTINAASRAEKDSPSDLKLQQFEFWNQFKTYLEKENSELSTGRSAKPKHYYNIKINTSEAHLSMNFLAREQQIACHLVIHKDKSIYHRIQNDRSRLETELGNDLEWESNLGIARSYVSKSMAADPTIEANWPSYFQWLKENGEKFQKAFRPYFNV
jgi:hypothetical protein